MSLKELSQVANAARNYITRHLDALDGHSLKFLQPLLHMKRISTYSFFIYYSKQAGRQTKHLRTRYVTRTNKSVQRCTNVININVIIYQCYNINV